MIYQRYIKRFLDVLLGLVALVPIAACGLVIAVLIKAGDRGPVFYNAERVGKDGQMFKMYKFRTMIVNAPDLRASDGSTYNAPDDPRLTRTGSWLRKTSLDELPQILNIIKGDMSFIGPRPDIADEVALYTGDDDRKLLVRPGITGYAQVSGRNAIPWKERLQLDIYYVDHLSFPLDVRIFVKTFAVIFKAEGIYTNADLQEPENK